MRQEEKGDSSQLLRVLGQVCPAFPGLGMIEVLELVFVEGGWGGRGPFCT